MTEADDFAQLKRIRSQEGQLLSAEITIIREMSREVNEAVIADRGKDIERSIAIIRNVFGLETRLEQLEAGVAQDEVAAAAEGARIGQEGAQEQQAARQEILLDQQEIEQLNKIENDLQAMLSIIYANQAAAKRADLIRQITDIEQRINAIAKLENMEINDQRKIILTEGVGATSNFARYLQAEIGTERNFLGLLRKLVLKIKELLSNDNEFNRPGGIRVISTYVEQTKNIVNKMIKINLDEIKRLRLGRT